MSSVLRLKANLFNCLGYHNVVSRALVGAQPLFDQFSSLYANLPTNLIIKPQMHRHSTLISLSGNTGIVIIRFTF